MDYLEKLKLFLPMVGTTKKYKGHWFKIYDCLVILVCECLCGLGNLKQIYRYAKNRVTKQMLKQVFNIHKIPCYSQFTNIMNINDNTQLEEAFRSGLNGSFMIYKVKPYPLMEKQLKQHVI